MGTTVAWVAAVTRAPSLAQKLLHATGVTKKKKKKNVHRIANCSQKVAEWA